MTSATCRLLLLILSFIVASATSLTCLDSNGQAVDWFIAIKVPNDAGSEDDDEYYFMTAKTPQWKLSSCNVKSQCGPIYDTVQQAYSLASTNSTVSILYNDEKPEDYNGRWGSSTYGHMKGVLAFDTRSTGFWLIHSAPKFPETHQYGYPSSGLFYGQHFFCVTYQYSQLALIARQLSIARPDTFTFNLPDWLAKLIPDLYTVAYRKPPRSSATSLTQQLTSLGGATFIHFSKSRFFGKDLYSDLVAPSLETSIFMEGWVNGRGDLNSSCSNTYKVLRVEEVQLMDEEWKTSKDHSKWAVSNDPSKPWVCLGDINRQKSQFRRGGGTLCYKNDVIWTAFRKVVERYQEC